MGACPFRTVRGKAMDLQVEHFSWEAVRQSQCLVSSPCRRCDLQGIDTDPISASSMPVLVSNRQLVAPDTEMAALSSGKPKDKIRWH